MRFASWEEFTVAFKTYISNTEGLFTMRDAPNFAPFRLERFLEHRAAAASDNEQFYMYHIEMLMALACFIEMNSDSDISIFPERVILNMKTLIAHKWLRIHPSSPIHAYMEVDQQQTELYLEAEEAEIAYLVDRIM